MKISLFREESDNETWVDVVQFFTAGALIIVCALLEDALPALESWIEIRLFWIERMHRINFIYGGISSFSLATPVLVPAFFIATKNFKAYLVVGLFLLLSTTSIYLYISLLCKI